MDPHATDKARSCKDCHLSAKTLGLGYGSLAYQGGGEWRLETVEAAPSKLLGLDFPLSAVTDLSGRVWVHFSRPDLRAFSPQEMRRILRVGLCLPCHKDFSDPVMRHWPPERKCTRFQE